MCPKPRLPSVVTKTKPVPDENHRSFLASIIPMSCDKILAFNYSPPIWGFRGHWWEAAAASFAHFRNKLPLVCLSKPTGALRHTEKEVFDLCHTLWAHFMAEGRRVRLIFGDGWYLWQVILEGGSPLLHRSPPLPCLMDITRCPRWNLQFWFSPKQTSPDVKA